MPLLSGPARIAELESASSDGSRFLDLSLKLRQKSSGEILLRSGGRWDRINREYVGPAPRCRVIDVEEAQVEFVRWWSDWLERKKASAPRDRITLAGGPRRSGKTFICTFAAVAAALDAPGSINWIVSPTFQQRDELERLIKNWLPRSWWRYRDAPIYRFTMANGSTIQLLSGDDPDTLKRGGASVVFFNEAQQFDVHAISNGLPAIIDGGGACILAANPPQRAKGEWILGLRDGILDKTIPGGHYVAFAAGLNTTIDQAAREDVGKILSVIDPKAAIADDEGQWLPVGDRAYPKFDKKVNLGSVPQLGDITADWMRKKIGRAYNFVGGADFQGNPWHCGVVVKLFKGATDQEPIYHVVEEQLTEGVEEDFLEEFSERYEAELVPNNLLWVGDASGQFQAGDHTRGRQSFDIWKKYGWRIVPPVEKKSDKGMFSKNPNIDDRLNLVNKLLSQGRLIIDADRCPRLAESIKDCELKMYMGRRRPVGRHAHITDSLGYALFYLEPRTKIYRKPTPGDIRTIFVPKQGPRIL